MVSETPQVSALFDFSDRVVLVTGASGGIGSAIARRFAEAGAKTVCHYRGNRAGADETVCAIESAGGTAAAVKADLSTLADANMLVAEAVRLFGRLDVLINNAGIQPVEPLLEISETSWHSMMAVNAGGPFLTTRAFADHLNSVSSGGAIVNIASIEGHQPASGHAHYAASKAALIMFTRASALELGPSNIRVNAISPGLIGREGIEKTWPEGVARWKDAAPLTRLGCATDVADAALFLASDAARWITGADLVVDGGVSTNPTW